MSTSEDRRERTIISLSEQLLETGMSRTSLRQLAAGAGVSDRMLMCYIRDKTDALSEVLT